MLHDLGWQSLDGRRQDQRLVLFYKIINGLVSVETEDILTSADSHTRKNHSFKFNLINHLCYDDDLSLISLSSSGMQKLLDMCSTYATEHVLTYNGSKSYSLFFKPKYIKLYAPWFYLNNLEIPKVDQCIYLGITISIKYCDIDMKRQMRKFYENINILSRKFSKCSHWRIEGGGLGPPP